MSQMIGGTDATMPTILWVADAEVTPLYKSPYNWRYRFRGFTPLMDNIGFFDNWTRSSMAAGDLTQPLGVFGLDNAQRGGVYEVTDIGFGGAIRLYFLVGQVVDANGNGVSGAAVNLFLSATFGLVSQTGCDASGNYVIGTPNIGATHFINAYLVGSPDTAGTTVNTLVPQSNPF